MPEVDVRAAATTLKDAVKTLGLGGGLFLN